MKKFLVAVVSTLLFSQLVLAEGTACDTKAADKKLAGAAKNSFIKKCERDAATETVKTSCDNKAAEKKLKGAAKNSFTKKCMADSTK